MRRVPSKRELPTKAGGGATTKTLSPDQTLVRRKAKTETGKVLIPVTRMATYASTAFTVQQQQYGGSGVQEQQQYQSAEQFHKARAESEQQQQLQQGNGCLTQQQQQQMTDETGCPVVSSTSAHEQGANGTDGGNGDGMRGNCNVNGVRQHDNIGSIITMLIADQVRKVVSIPLLPVSKLLLVC